MARLFLIDGSNHAFRVHFALPPMHAPDGAPTATLYGFTTMLHKLLSSYQPDYCAVAFDVSRTFRHDRYPEYKGHRPDMPEDLRAQWPLLPALVEAFGVKTFGIDGFEADDVMGTLAHRFAAEGLEVVLVTGDKDFCQLVGPQVRILDLMKGIEFGEEGVIEKFGVPPDKVIEALGLMGDSADNIPGVPGVGPKRATQFLTQYGSLEGVLAAAAAGKIKGKTGQSLIDHADSARLSAELATIHLAVPGVVDLPLEALAPKGMQREALRERFEAWGFGKVARKLLGTVSEVDSGVYRAVDSAEGLAALVADLRAAGRFAFDVETTSLDPRHARVVGMSFSWSGEDAVYVPVAHQEGGNAPEALEVLRPLLEDPSLLKTGQNLKYDLRVCRHNGIDLRGIDGDTLLLDYVLSPDERRHGLDALASRYLTHEMISYQEVSKREELTFDQVSVADATRYAAEDAQVAWLLERKLLPLLDPGQERIYRELEVPLVPILASLEDAGVRVDVEALAAVRDDVAERVQLAEEACHLIAGRSFNVNSRHELRDILFEELGYVGTKKVKDGWSTDSSVLEKLVGLQPERDLPANVLHYRHLSKLLGTYLDKLPEYVAEDGRIHSSFQQAVAATGRLSSSDPNLQNIPVRTWEGQRIRGCFLPAEGHSFLSCDYSQVELRILAHYSQEPALVEAFRDGVDIHRRTAAQVLGLPPEEVGAAERNAAKAINYGLIYGMSAFRLAGELGISRKQAQAYMDAYFGGLPAVTRWIEEVKETARADGFATTLLGRRRRLPDLRSAKWGLRMAAERLAVNTPIQGTAADIMKRAMIDVHEALAAEGLRSRVLLQVHDELLLEVPSGEERAAEALVRRCMMGAAALLVPLEVTSAFGEDWHQAHG
ncbi:MAG: DNA polymerase I [Deltaproteobacteria bacterium]|nr:DNA polymerase I [Deltaproteobacteria bacterium]